MRASHGRQVIKDGDISINLDCMNLLAFDEELYHQVGREDQGPGPRVLGAGCGVSDGA